MVPHKDFATREAFDAALADAIDAHAPALVVLAGFMRILTPGFVARYEGRLLNIHPSLLPAFPGLHTHRRAIEAGCRVAGVTVHQVTVDLDHGPILAQAVVPVMPDDTAETLAARVLAQEHRVYPRLSRMAMRNKMTQSPTRPCSSPRSAATLLFDLAKRNRGKPSISTVSPNMAAGRTHSPRSP